MLLSNDPFRSTMSWIPSRALGKFNNGLNTIINRNYAIKSSVMPTVLLTIFFVLGCTMFEKDEKLLKEHHKTNGETIKTFYVGLGATANDVIQVRKGELDTPLKVFERYNSLESSTLINDTTLRIIISDTGYYKNKADTFFVKVP